MTCRRDFISGRTGTVLQYVSSCNAKRKRVSEAKLIIVLVMDYQRFV